MNERASISSSTSPRAEGTALPNFFIVGAPKAGTTSLYRYCSDHPDVFMSELKEPHYLSSVDAVPTWRGQSSSGTHETGRFRVTATVNSFDAYTRLFESGAGYAIRGEASTSYLSDATAPSRIKELDADARVVAVLREPVARAVSHHQNLVREGAERRTLLEAISDELDGGWTDWATSYVLHGRYAEQVRRYQDAFGCNFAVFVYEEFFADPLRGMRALFEFLDVSGDAANTISFEYHNASRAPRNTVAAALLGREIVWKVGRRLPKRLRGQAQRALLERTGPTGVDPSAHALLEREYSRERGDLEALMGRTLPWQVPR